jgi:hypothetical protein
MKKLFGDAKLEGARRCASAIKKHDEQQSIAQFRGQELRDFLIPGCTVGSQRPLKEKEKAWSALSQVTALDVTLAALSVITLPVAKSRTRNKHDKDTPKSGSAYSERGVLLPVLTSGRRMSRCPGHQKIATRVPPIICNATQTSHPPDPTYEHAVCPYKKCVARDLLIQQTPSA